MHHAKELRQGIALQREHDPAGRLAGRLPAITHRMLSPTNGSAVDQSWVPPRFAPAQQKGSPGARFGRGTKMRWSTPQDRDPDRA